LVGFCQILQVFVGRLQGASLLSVGVSDETFGWG